MQETTPLPEPLEPDVPQLTANEARILGSLVEKAAATPEAYPLTVNAIVNACNQKTSREPVMHLQPGAVEHTLRAMQDKGLVKPARSSQRVVRYEHCFDAVYGVTARQRAVLCVMLLRGPQTPGELLTRTQRITEFPGAEEVRDTLARLIEREVPLIVDIGRNPGQRENRYMHLLSGPVDVSSLAAAAPTSARASRDELEQRVERLESELASMRSDLDELRKQSE